jgi:uncharacterized membrane protein (UPF0127 family)
MPGRKLFSVQNRTRGETLADKVLLADTPLSRCVGLLRRDSLGPGEGLWIYPTQAIHTIGMRFPIDVVFLDRKLCVRRMYHQLVPFRMTRFVWGARSALELSSGSLKRSGTCKGDQLHFESCGGAGD